MKLACSSYIHQLVLLPSRRAVFRSQNPAAKFQSVVDRQSITQLFQQPPKSFITDRITHARPDIGTLDVRITGNGIRRGEIDTNTASPLLLSS